MMCFILPGHGQSLYKSFDNGISWERISPFGSAFDIYSLTITQNGNLFIGIFDGWERVFKTTDGGLNWQDCSAGINSYVNEFGELPKYNLCWYSV